MKISIQAAAAAITLFASQAAHAQEAVQWKVSDGGNGHWYQRLPDLLTWPEAKLRCEALGGYLATPTSAGENDLVGSLNVPGPSPNSWIGGFQDPEALDFAEPAGGWRWVTGETWDFTAWYPPEPNNFGAYPEDFMSTWVGGNTWNDLAGGIFPGQKGYPSIIEWSADCNGDGIVDYGQCRNGSLPDYDGDNIPDCCERGDSCVVSHYPIQWRLSDGGNGHWYFTTSESGTWFEMRDVAMARGGALASLASLAENSFANLTRWPQDQQSGGGPWIGASKLAAARWSWIDGTPWDFTNWSPNEPCCGDGGLYVHLYPLGQWNDHNATQYACRGLIEWSADCNNDGIVDYGQILQGQLADTNADGVPDICQGPTCADADIYRDFNVNGADLGILLSQWGPNTPLTESDLNRDGVVNGADLGLLLSFWGTCP